MNKRMHNLLTCMVLASSLTTTTFAGIDPNYKGGGAFGFYEKTVGYEDEFYEEQVNNSNTETEVKETDSDFWEGVETSPGGDLTRPSTNGDPTYGTGYDTEWVESDKSESILDDIKDSGIDYDDIFKPNDTVDTPTDAGTDTGTGEPPITVVDDDIHRDIADSTLGMDVIGTFTGPKYIMDRFKFIKGTVTENTFNQNVGMEIEGNRWRVNGITLDDYTPSTDLRMDFSDASTSNLNTVVILPGSAVFNVPYSPGTVYNSGNIQLEPEKFNAHLYIGRGNEDTDQVYTITGVFVDSYKLDFKWDEDSSRLYMQDIDYSALGQDLYIQVNNGTTLVTKMPPTVGVSWEPETSVDVGTLNFSGVPDLVDITVIDDRGQLVPEGYVEIRQGKLLLSTSKFIGGKTNIRMYPMSAYGDAQISIRADGFECEPQELKLEIGTHDYVSVVKTVNVGNIINKDIYLELQDFEIASNGIVKGIVSIKGLPLANVVVKNAITGERYKTNKSGEFEFAATPGTYSLGVLKNALSGLKTEGLKLNFEFKEDYIEETVIVETVPQKQGMGLVTKILILLIAIAGAGVVALLIIRAIGNKKKNSEEVDLDTEIHNMLDDNDSIEMESILDGFKENEQNKTEEFSGVDFDDIAEDLDNTEVDLGNILEDLDSTEVYLSDERKTEKIILNKDGNVENFSEETVDEHTDLEDDDFDFDE